MLCERLGFLREGTECFVDGKGETSDEGSAGGCLPVLEEMLEGKHSFCLEVSRSKVGTSFHATFRTA